MDITIHNEEMFKTIVKVMTREKKKEINKYTIRKYLVLYTINIQSIEKNR